MARKTIVLMAFFLIPCLFFQGYSQGFLKKVTKQVEDKVNKKISGDDAKETKTDNSSDSGKESSDESGNTTGQSKRPQNTKGGGLVSTPPDVIENIASARIAADGKKYAEARYSIRQALLGVELEIGRNLLKTLPDQVDGLPKDTNEDKVVSSGIGFAGLMIHRVYHTEEKEIGMDIMNDGALYSGISLFLSNSGYAGTDSDKNMKQMRFKGYPSVIQYDEDKGYTLSVPFGQSSLFVINGINYDNETAFMNAVSVFDLEKIKSELGEK